MEIGFQLNTAHSYWIFDFFLVIHGVILWHYVNDLAARRYNDTVHVLRQTINIFNTHLVIFRTTGDAAMMHGTTNMLACNSNIHHTNINARHIACFLNGLSDGEDSLINIGDNTFDNAF